MCYQKKNQISEAILFNDKCLELNPTHIKARYRKALLYAHNKEFDLAKSVANSLISEAGDGWNQDFRNLLDTV